MLRNGLGREVVASHPNPSNHFRKRYGIVTSTVFFLRPYSLVA